MAQILHVEDDPDLRKIMGMVLQAVPHAPGWSVVQVGSVSEARAEMAQWDGPALLLADQRLPDGDGIELAYEARRAHPDVRIVILTALSGLECPPHVDEVVEKPWGLDAMEEALRGITGRWVASWAVAP